jgi:hypothetical protein
LGGGAGMIFEKFFKKKEIPSYDGELPVEDQARLAVKKAMDNAVKRAIDEAVEEMGGTILAAATQSVKKAVDLVIDHPVVEEKEGLSDSDMTMSLLEKWAMANRYVVFTDNDGIHLKRVEDAREYEYGDSW